MPKYTSKTGRNVILRFNGIVVTIPANGYYETRSPNIDKIFPEQIRRLQEDEILKEVEPEIPKLNIQEIHPQVIKNISIPDIPSINFPTPKSVEITAQIAPSSPILIQSIVLPIQKYPSPKLRNVIINTEFNKKVTEIINNSMGNNEDPDVLAFLEYIGQIISQKGGK